MTSRWRHMIVIDGHVRVRRKVRFDLDAAAGLARRQISRRLVRGLRRADASAAVLVHLLLDVAVVAVDDAAAAVMVVFGDVSRRCHVIDDVSRVGKTRDVGEAMRMVMRRRHHGTAGGLWVAVVVLEGHRQTETDATSTAAATIDGIEQHNDQRLTSPDIATSLMEMGWIFENSNTAVNIWARKNILNTVDCDYLLLFRTCTGLTHASSFHSKCSTFMEFVFFFFQNDGQVKNSKVTQIRMLLIVWIFEYYSNTKVFVQMTSLTATDLKTTL